MIQMSFLNGCVNGSRIRRRGCRQARGRTVGSGLFQTTERSRILSLLPARAGDLLRDRDAVPRRRGYDGGGFTRTSLTYYVSDVTTEEARALVKALDDAGLKRDGGLGYSFEIPGTSVDPPPPEKGPVRNVVYIMFDPYLPHGETVCLECG